ncbi:MAG: N-acetylmuramoyl-L-alanine amidase [marine benthic group bacterium]|nr:N-acetylmuramoyl-L-alanine amidase [Gemmatimonadota bacterium]
MRGRSLLRRPVWGALCCAVLLGPAHGIKAQMANGGASGGPGDDRGGSAVGGEPGYPVFRWSAAPEDLVRGPSLTAGRGSAYGPGGDAIEVRAGAPFARLGDRVLPLANSPYLSGGDLWVPSEFLERLEMARREARNGLIVEIPRPGETGGESVSSAQKNGPWKITIDPGHGGHDPGTVNRRTGAREKDIVLAVGRKLAEELRRRPGFEVELTRDDDRFIPLKERPKRARTSGSDLFVSIHVNAEPNGGTRANGFETYFLSPARTDESSRVARLENSVLELEGETLDFEGEAPIDKIVSMIVLDGNRDVSQDFGEVVQTGLNRVAVGKDRGTKPGPFWVLVGATGHMPAVLVELGFITNPNDVKKLTDDAYQARLAVALADSIEEYRDRYVRSQMRRSGGG